MTTKQREKQALEGALLDAIVRLRTEDAGWKIIGTEESKHE